MNSEGAIASAPGPPLVIVGGYGLVGAQLARVLRKRHPRLPLVLAGRNPERAAGTAASVGASTMRIDVEAERPLAALRERPAALIAAVSDPQDRLLVDAMRRGIPFADIGRGGHADILDVAVLAARERPSAPVIMSGSWFGGLAALIAAAAVRELGGAERVDIAILASSDDRVGPNSWGFSERLAWPYYAMRGSTRRPTHPLTGLRHVPCADGQARPGALVGTLEQTTLPLIADVPTVETRIALQSSAALFGLVGLKRTGALRALARPGLRGVRERLLQGSGSGDFAGLTVTAERRSASASVELLDPRGQGHLTALGAACAAERLLGLAAPAGLSFPEQFPQPDVDLDLLRQSGVTVRLQGFRSREPEASRPVPRRLAEVASL
jgi:hypothetical protein